MVPVRHIPWLARAASQRVGLLLLALLVVSGGWPLTARAQTRSYVIDAAASSVQVILRREGAFSVLAHDHVLLADGFAGRVAVDRADVSRAAVQITLPVASLIVDPPDAREALQMEGDLDDEDRAEIRESMLAEDQLDAEQFPRIVATLESVTGTLPELELALRVRIRQTERVLSVPTRVEFAGDRLEASGEFTLLQSDFGIEPYSTLLGAIAVRDLVTVRFRVVARAEPA